MTIHRFTARVRKCTVLTHSVAFPLPVSIPEPPQSGGIIHLMAHVIHDEAPVTANQIACATNSNPDLSQIKLCVMSGDWASLPKGAKPYLIRKDGLC